MKDVREILDETTNKWFLREPFLFSVFCTHRLVENNAMDCCMRSGKMRIEYNCEMLEIRNRDEISELLRREVLRIVLKHPYQRQPLCAIPNIMYLASNLTLFQNGATGINPMKQEDYKMLLCCLQNTKPSFEEIYKILLNFSAPSESSSSDESNTPNSQNSRAQGIESAPNKNEDSGARDDNNEKDLDINSICDNNKESNENGDSKGNSTEDDGGNANYDKELPGENDSTNGSPRSYDKMMGDTDATGLWEEDPLFVERINCQISETGVNGWGSISGLLQGIIKASTRKAENLMRKLEIFRTSILKNDNTCTRMRPSRRYGWAQMGKLHPYCSRLLLGIDTSGSISDTDLEKFYSVINSFFAIGFPEIDVLMFDAEIHLPVIKFKNTKDSVKIVGRGGTLFDPVIKYYEANRQYDGLIMFTDGCAPLPIIPKGKKVLWALTNRFCYDHFDLNPKICLPE